MPTRICGPNPALYCPGVYPSVQTKESGLRTALNSDDGRTVPVVRSASS